MGFIFSLFSFIRYVLSTHSVADGEGDELINKTTWFLGWLTQESGPCILKQYGESTEEVMG